MTPHPRKFITFGLGLAQVGIAAALGYSDWAIREPLKGTLVIAAAVVAFALNSLPSLFESASDAA